MQSKDPLKDALKDIRQDTFGASGECVMMCDDVWWCVMRLDGVIFCH